MAYFLLTLLLLCSVFLILVILIQRGRGGGLAGAFGGLGGQSAFGTKAGDVFTVITIVTAVVWVVLACLAGWRLRVHSLQYNPGASSTTIAPDSKAKDNKKAGSADDQDPLDKAPGLGDDQNGGPAGGKKGAAPRGEADPETEGADDDDQSLNTPSESDDTKPDDEKPPE